MIKISKDMFKEVMFEDLPPQHAPLVAFDYVRDCNAKMLEKWKALKAEAKQYKKEKRLYKLRSVCD